MTLNFTPFVPFHEALMDQWHEVREQRQRRARWESIPEAVRAQMMRGDAPKVKRGRGQRRNRRNGTEVKP